MTAIVRGESGIVEFCKQPASSLGIGIEIHHLDRKAVALSEYISLPITRSPYGQVVSYEPVRHSYIRQRLASEPIADQSFSMMAQELTIEYLRSNNLIGSSIAIFNLAGDLIEMLSGINREALWTLEFSYISHFENEVRSARNLPLGSSFMTQRNWFALEYSAPHDLDMTTPYLHLFAHDPNYKIHQITSHAGIVLAIGDIDLVSRVRHAVDYLEGVVNE